MATWQTYHKFKLRQLNGSSFIDLDTDTIKVMLCSSTYVPNLATDQFKTSATGEVSGTNYVAGGIALAGVTLTLNSGTVTWNRNDVTWNQSAGGFNNARYAVMYKATGVDATSALIELLDLGNNYGNVVGDLILQISANGIFALS